MILYEPNKKKNGKFLGQKTKVEFRATKDHNYNCFFNSFASNLKLRPSKASEIPKQITSVVHHLKLVLIKLVQGGQDYSLELFQIYFEARNKFNFISKHSTTKYAHCSVLQDQVWFSWS